MMKNRKRKIIFAILSFIIALFAIASIMIGISSQKNNLYTIKIDDYDKTDKLIIKNIYIGDTYYDIENFKDEYLNYDSKNSYLKCNKNCVNGSKIFELDVSSIDNLKLSFLNENNSIYTLKVYKNGNYYTTIDINEKNGEYYFYDNVSTISMLIKYMSQLSVIGILLYIIIMFIVLAISYFSINYIFSFADSLKNSKFDLRKFILSVILLFIINLFYFYLLMQFVSWLCILPSVVSLIALILYISKEKKVGINEYFSLIIMFVGITFIFCFPPLHVPDEASHFIKSYQTSFVFQNNHETEDKYGRKGYAYLPKKMRNFIIKYGSQTDNFEYKLQSRTYLHDLFDINDYNDLSNKTTWYGTKFSSPVPYLPGTIVAIFARITCMPILLFYIIGKLLTFIIGSIMCYYALKITPYFKKIFFIVPLLPIYFQQSAGYCMDWLTNSTFLLLLSILLKNIYSNNKITKKNVLIIILITILLCFCKFGYFPLLLLMLLIPTNKFSDKNNKITMFKKILIIMLAVVLSISINMILNRIGNATNLPSSRNTIPISNMLSQPFKIFTMVIETFKIRLDLDFFRGLVDGFGWSTVWSNSLVLFLSMTLLMLIIFCRDDNNKKLTKKQFTIISISFIIICAIIYGAMLFGWTIKGNTSIDGLQPRYFIPAATLLYILVQSNFMTIKVKNKNIFYSVIIISINALAMITIISGFYS